MFLLVAAMLLVTGQWMRISDTSRRPQRAGPAPVLSKMAVGTATDRSNDPVGVNWRKIVEDVPPRSEGGSMKYHWDGSRNKLDSMCDGRDSRFLARIWALTYDMSPEQEDLIAKKIQIEREDAFSAYADGLEEIKIDGKTCAIVAAHELYQHSQPELWIGKYEKHLGDWLKENQWDAIEFEEGRLRASKWLEEIGITDQTFFQLDEEQLEQLEQMQGKPLRDAVMLLRRDQLLSLWWTSPRFAELLNARESARE